MARRRESDHVDHVERLLDQANDLPHGPTRIELCEEAVRVADSHGDTTLAFRARDELTTAASMGERPDLMIVSFSWCLSMFDRKEDTGISAFQLLWKMKWVAAAIPRFPEIELATIHKMLDDMERRFREHSGSIQPVVHKRRSVALMTGHDDEARRAHKQFMRLPRSFLSDCQACELGSLAGYWMDMGRRTLGIRKGEELIASGRTCATVPDSTYADLLLPMLHVGRGKEAMVYHHRGYERSRRSAIPLDMCHWGDHIAFLALTGNDARAIKLLETHMPLAEAGHDPLSTLSFLRNMLVTVDCLGERKAKIKMRLPAESPLANSKGEYDLAEMAKTLTARVLQSSRRFDERNGNDNYCRAVDRAMKLKKKAMRVPLR